MQLRLTNEQADESAFLMKKYSRKVWNSTDSANKSKAEKKATDGMPVAWKLMYFNFLISLF